MKPHDITALGASARPWASYLVQMHTRVHPIFADGFVAGLAALGPTHPLNDKKLVTIIEIVLKPDGTIDRLGVVKSSGLTAFDIGALDAFDRAAPFGAAPPAIVSADGRIYLQWEMHRDELECSTVGVRPYILRPGSTP